MLRLQTRQQRIDYIAYACIERATYHGWKAGVVHGELGRPEAMSKAALLAAVEFLMHYRSDPRSTTMATNTTTTSGMPQSACNSTNTGGPAGGGSKPAGGGVKTISPAPGGGKTTKVSGGGPSKNYSY